ncbi:MULTISPECIES: site-specific integrase [unclassified Streptomyces]|uniref:tyrosine-type recombinase/integrase n=1 Tax=unclassified Streptomyces TaxID=2593676 RepID=UPI0023665101|nr:MULTISPECIES: site-specific integrase [unclassified Streptomyces]MDF3142845.1 site-specific integrase [Streptomyces sp. T21Q-yed]WDF42366.1 site-specific integrase [Streptomyces sp. T12]
MVVPATQSLVHGTLSTASDCPGQLSGHVARTGCTTGRWSTDIATTWQRDEVPGAAAFDYVFINLLGPYGGRSMTYSNARQIIERIGLRCGFRARPHMMRHTAATRWIRGGVDPDVVQTIVGHVSSASTAVYLHATDDDLRAAVELAAAGADR